MIHAYFFVKQGGSLDRDGHGTDFQDVMNQINGREGSKITIYHTFHYEVANYQVHHWRCSVSYVCIQARAHPAPCFVIGAMQGKGAIFRVGETGNE